MRIVLDTNCLIVSIPRKSKYRLVFDSFLDKKYSLIISNEILSEYLEILSQKFNTVVAIDIAEIFLSSGNVEKREVYYRWNLITNDEDDNKYADCAIASNADFIVTNDRHFEVLKKKGFPKVNVISLNEFIEMLK